MIKVTPNFTAALTQKSERDGIQNLKDAPSFEKKPKREYNDPLMQWPVRGMAFTNDIGAAIMDIAPKAGTFLWYPAMMYFGADIYDKYRNDKEQYDPNAKRGFKQAIFQALASVMFPIITVHTGQKIASLMARKSDTKLSLQTQEESTKFLVDFMSRRKLGDYQNNTDKFKSEFDNALDNYIDTTTRKHQNKNFIKKTFDMIFGSRHPEEMGKEGNNRRQIIHEYTAKKIDNLFELRAELLKDDTKKPAKLSNKLFKEYKTLFDKYSKDADFQADAKSLAIKDILSKVETSNIFKTKIKKTIGGFVALGLLIKPIDLFVEHIIMEKYVDPGLDYISANTKNQINNFKNKNIKQQ